MDRFRLCRFLFDHVVLDNPGFTRHDNVTEPHVVIAICDSRNAACYPNDKNLIQVEGTKKPLCKRSRHVCTDTDPRDSHASSEVIEGDHSRVSRQNPSPFVTLSF
jgi:hypothetical protein